MQTNHEKITYSILPRQKLISDRAWAGRASNLITTETRYLGRSPVREAQGVVQERKRTALQVCSCLEHSLCNATDDESWEHRDHSRVERSWLCVYLITYGHVLPSHRCPDQTRRNIIMSIGANKAKTMTRWHLYSCLSDCRLVDGWTDVEPHRSESLVRWRSPAATGEDTVISSCGPEPPQHGNKGLRVDRAGLTTYLLGQGTMFGNHCRKQNTNGPVGHCPGIGERRLPITAVLWIQADMSILFFLFLFFSPVSRLLFFLSFWLVTLVTLLIATRGHDLLNPAHDLQLPALVSICCNSRLPYFGSPCVSLLCHRPDRGTRSLLPPARSRHAARVWDVLSVPGVGR